MNASKANILKLVADGMSVKMTCSYFIDEICAAGIDEYPNLEYMLSKFIQYEASTLGDTRPWFDTEAFRQELDDPLQWPHLKDMLLALSNYDLGLRDCWVESGIDEDDISGLHELKYASLIESETIWTFEQFFESDLLLED